MCECGAWKNYDELEDELTLDELFILYDMAITRIRRFMDTVAAALGAEVEGDEPHQAFDQGAFIPDGQVGDIKELNKDINMSYTEGGIGPSDHDHFAYFKKKVEDE